MTSVRRWAIENRTNGMPAAQKAPVRSVPVVSFSPGMSANPTITGNLLIHTFHCRLKSHSWKRFWDYDTFVV